jgi:hypothetical protein
MITQANRLIRGISMFSGMDKSSKAGGGICVEIIPADISNSHFMGGSSRKHLIGNASELFLKIPRAVLRRGGVAGCVAPRLQISGEYAPSSRLAIHSAALAIPFPVYFQNRLLRPGDFPFGPCRVALVQLPSPDHEPIR